MNLRILICAALLAALLTIGLACGDDDDGGTATPSGSAEAAGTPGPTAPANLPQDFPEDFPLYPSADFDNGARIGNQVLASFRTTDSRADVAEFYSEELDTAPWQIRSETESGNGLVLLVLFARTEGGISGSMTLTAEAGTGTAISVNFTVPESVDTTLPPVATMTASAEAPEPSETE